MKLSTSRVTFMDVAIPKSGILLDVALVLGFACITALCAQISFWLGMVPITGQTFGVLLSGALLGSRRGALSQLSYLGIGATGIPYWFALGGPVGIARLLGPTGGYLLGFVAAAFVVGLLAERGWDRRPWTAIPAMIAGSIIMYVFGLAWLSNFVPKGTVLEAGLYPFIIGDVLKIIAAALTLPSCWLLIRRLKGC